MKMVSSLLWMLLRFTKWHLLVQMLRKQSGFLSTKQKTTAKAAAKKAGRPYPNLVDNMRAAKGK